MSLNPAKSLFGATPEAYTNTTFGNTTLTLPPVVKADGFPQFTRGQFSGAVFLMINPTFGYSITDGTNCVLPLGEIVSSMQAMIPYEDKNYDEYLDNHLNVYEDILIARGVITEKTNGEPVRPAVLTGDYQATSVDDGVAA